MEFYFWQPRVIKVKRFKKNERFFDMQFNNRYNRGRISNTIMFFASAYRVSWNFSDQKLGIKVKQDGNALLRKYPLDLYCGFLETKLVKLVRGRRKSERATNPNLKQVGVLSEYFFRKMFDHPSGTFRRGSWRIN